MFDDEKFDVILPFESGLVLNFSDKECPVVDEKNSIVK